jgi:hypothetical protein
MPVGVQSCPLLVVEGAEEIFALVDDETPAK